MNNLEESIITSKYPSYFKIKNDEKYTEEDLQNYVSFCDRSCQKDIGSWNQYRDIVNKINKKGVASVLFNSNLTGISRSDERLVAGGPVEPIIRLTFRGLPTIVVARDGIWR